ncbi:MAG TPA: DegT/DnrJ/EryC1/StrS family aminotransferase [Oscillospiraceae bacterium]|nr:DegT/DnrJ/EryC1/StrS family aminotransferase [Oscillospiraceae bacterium]
MPDMLVRLWKLDFNSARQKESEVAEREKVKFVRPLSPNFKKVEEYIEKRKAVAAKYRNELKNVKGIRFLDDIPGVKHSYTYFPVLIDEKIYGESRDEVYERLKKNNIYGRRYFYPLISRFSTYRGLASASAVNLPVAEKIANQVICLPIFPDLKSETIKQVITLLNK